jgi:hypothetical protein
MGGHNLPVEIGLTYLNLGKAAALPALPLIMSLILTIYVYSNSRDETTSRDGCLQNKCFSQ